MKNKRKENKNAGIGLGIAAIIMAAGVFSVMTYIRVQALSDFEKKEVYAASSFIPRGTVIDDENKTMYLTLKEVDAGCVSGACLDAGSDIGGLSPVFDIEPGVILTGNMFTSSEHALEEMECPVLAGFRTDDLAKAVSGCLRSGDSIDIYTLDEDSGDGRLLCGDIYIECGYDINGNVATDLQTAVMFNIFIESDKTADFYAGLQTGKLYVVKRC